MSSRSHWEHIYTSRAATSVSWYQPHAARSLGLIRRVAGPPTAAIIDVGGGASTLVDDLLAAGYEHPTVLDLSDTALAVARERLGLHAERVHWIAGNVTAIGLTGHAYDVWHDRAVFHFVTDEDERRAYVAQLLHALKPGGHAIIATFALDGPTECSGLPVMRYSPATLHAELGAGFVLVEYSDEAHVTPAGRTQRFVYCLFAKPR